MEASEFTTSWSAFLPGSTKTSTNTVLLILTLNPAGKIGGKNNTVMYDFPRKKLLETHRGCRPVCMYKSLVSSGAKPGHPSNLYEEVSSVVKKKNFISLNFSLLMVLSI